MTNYGRLLVSKLWIYHSILTLGILIIMMDGVMTDTMVKSEVHTFSGVLEGKPFYTERNRSIHFFEGVPYASPPIGDLRFEHPQVLKRWTGVRKPKEMPRCLQLDHTLMMKGESNFIVGSEDCLYMNIYTPFLYRENTVNQDFNYFIPVIVYIHGGTFMHGYGGDHTPKYLLDRMDAVFVTINYRLGPFGFLTTESGIIPGNMGLKDQVAALEWINKNIFLFRGDKNKVTLVGNTAGGASVHYHYLSEQSKHLFDKGISMSGTALCPWALMERGLEKTKQLFEAMKCSQELIEDQIECLKQKKGKSVLEATHRLFFKWLYNPFSPFGPTIEWGSQKPFIDNHPFELIRLLKAKNVPWLVSVVSHEGLYPVAQFMTNNSYSLEIDSNWFNLAPHLLDYNYTVLPKFKDIVSHSIGDFYLEYVKKAIGGWSLSEDEVYGHYEIALIRLFGDRFFNAYCGLAARMHAHYYSYGTYFYKFGYRGNNSLSTSITGIQSGVGNGDDLIYLLGSFFWGFDFGSEDYRMVKKMQRLLISFVKHQKPTLASNLVWQPIQKTGLSIDYMNIESPNDISMKNDDDFGTLRYWMTLNLDENNFYKFLRYYSYPYEKEWLVED